ncbi:MAG TPA: diguanylate cyclase [Patescibacteria group bacterium]|nr:diguanylate cyclase [Patescibacteria group bacterium]
MKQKHKEWRHFRNLLRRVRQDTLRYREIIELQQELVLRFLPSGEVTFANQAFYEYFKLRPGELTGKLIDAYILHTDRLRSRHLLEELTPETPRVVIENRVLRGDGSIRWVRWTGLALYDEGGFAREFQLVGQDITERKWTEERLRAGERMQHAILEAIPDALFRLSRQGTIFSHKGEEGVLNQPEVPLVGRHVTDVLPPTVAIQLLRELENAFVTGRVSKFEYSVNTNGVDAYLEARIIMLTEDEALMIVRNFTERYQMEEQLNYLSWHDSLTKLYNRHFFEKEISRVAAMKNWSGGAIVCDVDGLKVVNDMLGHKYGDELLIAASQAIRQSVRDADVVARTGGDEFAVIMLNADVEALEQACRRIREAAFQYNESGEQNVPLRLSCGFAATEEGAQPVYDLLRQADAAMYQDKNANRLESMTFIVEKTVRMRGPR